jgi:pyruvate/2-oxoglutarate dehydrogenase complex dihydrolipoamide acyltransferase (E2) component
MKNSTSSIVGALIMASCLTAGGFAAAQDAAPTAPTKAPASTAPASTAPASTAPASTAPTSAAAAKRAAHIDAGEPRAHASEPRAQANDARAQAEPHGSDRVDLDATTVTGNQELPKVMYIVPWKKSDIGDLAGKPMNSLLDEVLAPVDRDVFRREVKYYDAVHADVTQNGATPTGASQPANPAQQVEK